MGTFKKEANRKERQGKVGDGMGNVRVKGENFYRDAKKLRTLNMLKDGKAQRNAEGTITKAASYQSRDAPVARIEPNRKWFGNTRVISQEALTSFREAVAERASDPYQVLLKTNKLPMSLIRDDKGTVNGLKQHEAKMAIETSPYSDTFGPKAQRKRVKLGVASLEDLAGETARMQNAYIEKSDHATHDDGTMQVNGDDVTEFDDNSTLPTAKESVFLKGQSKRIWNELYKVIDSSDVVIHLLDARDPEGTRCRSVEKYIREEAPHKHLIFILNKCDLVPTGVAAAWVRRLSKDYPTLAFHASINNSFGKGSLIQLLRQFSALHTDRKQISVGFIGYPNTGKSSVINTLRKKKVCTVAPIPGETKVWQYVTLMKRIYLIDCPGVVPPNPNDSPQDILLRGVVRVENVENPEQYIPAVLSRVQPRHLERTYGIKVGAEDPIEFLSILARKGGRLLRGGEPDLDGVAKMVINDFLRGKIPWYTPPPKTAGEGEEGEGEAKIEGRTGRLGEMPRKRKLEETTSEAAADAEEASDKQKSENEEFEGFGSDEDDDDSIANLEVSDEESGEEND
ncbi:NGP1NT-domain-containing protein [Aspergillus heteromorphus CBS 117.55]|uniref:Nucleolar GTP-binding protein 2 n=1 Tax=Aspergillus heteromorphus CBS 117.55 TaxID=1448321 RepID=A0A317WHU9_9EURO|nr:NGP1NT-domain-containing protein [Aspergillus heteromorphus CBS 117.55]PWY86064.1 NGP1NT-domain-containing protein [Aspergillus heteromorphus CBS 117.55]